MTGLFSLYHPVINPLHHKKTMANNTLDKDIEAIPNFGKRIKLFTEKLRIAQYADNSIYDYRLKIAQAVLFFKKLPDEFTQTDIDYYLSTLLDKNRCSLSFFKHMIFGLQAYYKVMGLKQPGGLVLPPVRKPKRLPRVLSQEQIARLLRNCSLNDKTLLAIIYDCALRVGEACRLRWDDICFDRKKQLDVPPEPKERTKKSYLEICQEKGWEIGVCKECHCQRIIVRTVYPLPRAPPFFVKRIGN